MWFRVVFKTVETVENLYAISGTLAARFERATFGLGNRCSIQLSYASGGLHGSETGWSVALVEPSGQTARAPGISTELRAHLAGTGPDDQAETP